MATQIQIKSFAPTHLTLSLHAAFHRSVEKLIAALGPATLHVETQYARYSPLVADELKISNRQTTYVTTAKLEDGVQERNNSVGVMLNVVRAYLTSTLMAKRIAAESLYAVLAPFYGLGKRKYAEATLDAAAMFAALRNEECAAWLETLHLTEDFAEAETKNQNVESLIEQKSLENVARSSQADIETNEHRRSLDEVFKEICTIANAYSIVAPTEANNQFISTLNGTIDTYKSYIDASSSNTPTVNPSPDEPETPDDSEGTDTPDTGGDTTPEGGGTDSGEGDGGESGGETPTPGGGDEDDGGSLVG